MSTLPERLAEVLTSFRPDEAASYDALDALYAPDMVFVDPLQRVEGLAGFRAMNERIFRKMRYVRFEDVTPVGDEPHFMLSWTMVFRAKVGGEMRTPGVSELRTEGGKIVHHRDHWDLIGTVMSGFPHLEPIYKRIAAMLG
jgi:ketosteroid isomerase-like protein